MSQGLSQHVQLLAVNRAFSRFAHVTGYIAIAGALLEVIGYQSAASTAVIWPVIPALAITLALLVILDRRRTTFFSVLFLVVGGASQYWLSFALLSAFPSIHSSHTLAMSLVAVSLILVCGPGFAPLSTIVWGTIGYAIGVLASLAASLAAGSPFQLDAIPLVVVIGLVLVELTDAFTRSRRLAAGPQLDQAVIDEELFVLRYRIEVRAAAMMHDTVLNHLAAVAAGTTGKLNANLRTAIEKDLGVLIGEDWLNDPVPSAADDQARSDWRRSAVLVAVQEARELSLDVEVTGDLGAIGRLTGERDNAVGLAVKQCLVNVLRHAQIDHAEVAIIGSESDVSIMVIDAGRGFSEPLVESDRLGLRQSVRKRIEGVNGEVRLWSTPGRGTSVLIRVPAPVASGISNE